MPTRDWDFRSSTRPEFLHFNKFAEASRFESYSIRFQVFQNRISNRLSKCLTIREEKMGKQAKQVNKMTKTSRNVEIFRRQALSKQKTFEYILREEGKSGQTGK